MWLGQIDLPEELLEAKSRDELVIFAGAGVSRPPPSSLPDFGELVRALEGASTISRKRHEALDAYLGRLSRAQFPVHREVQQRIGRADSWPNRLHRAIVRLFSTAETVRVVTTNFDRHLTTAARERWSEIQEFVAPALPPGENFRGIVYLHGAVDPHPESLVLTDTDFGIAYLTKGFARRFLVELFHANWVLFLGFSHSDTVLNYLARGLPPGTHRYAMTSTREIARWEAIGITPIVYPRGSRREVVIAGCLEAWGRDLSMQLSDHKQRIRDLVRRGPDGLDPDSRDYLVARTRDPDTIAFFCQEANEPGWLDRLANIPEFEALFLHDDQDGEVIRELALWFSERFSIQYPQHALLAVARRDGRLSPVLWHAISGHFHRDRPASDVLEAWLPLLLANAPDRSQDALGYLLHDSRPGLDDQLALLLFDFLTEPRPRSRVLPGVFSESRRDQADIEVAARGNPYWLSESFQRVFKPRIGSFARDLLALATRHLEHARQILGTEDAWDPLSRRRSAIEPHDQDSSPSEWSDVLVDAARESIEWAIAHDRELVSIYLGLWERARAPLLRRLAVHCIRRADWLETGEKLDWLLDRGRVFAIELHHEVYQLLADTFPAASSDGRARILAAIEHGPDEEPAASDQELQDRLRLDLLESLATHARDADAVTEARGAILARHPDWRLMDEAHWLETPAPSTQDVLAQDPEDPAVLGRLLSYRTAEQGHNWFSSPRRPLLERVAAACREDPGWGLRLARSLARKSEWQSDLWRSVIDGWNEGSLEPAAWSEILELIQDNPEKSAHASSIARLLEQAARARPPRIPADLLSLADRVALAIWDALDGDGGEATSSRDWLTEAINEPAGQLMIYFLHSLELRGPSARLPEDLRQVFQAAVEGTKPRDSLGASVLASQLHFLHARDRDWTCEVLIPGMHWDRDAARAQQMWHGFLTWGKLNPSLTEDLLPAYMSVFAHVDGLGELAGRFTEHLALVAFLTAKDPLEHGWLKVFVQRNSDERVAQWTHHVTFRLRDMPDPDRRAAWRRWIAQYWRQRNDGVPRTLQDQEARELVAWALETDEDFDQALNLVCAGPRVGAPPSIFYERFRECGHAVRRPAAAARLLAHALAGERRPFWECDEASEVAMAAARSGQAHPNELRAILEQLLRLRCGGSDALRGAIEGSE